MTPRTPTTLLDDLSELDPATEVELSPSRVANRDKLYTRIVSNEHPQPRPSRTRRPLAIAVASAAALALVAGIVVSAVPALTQAPVASYALPAHGSLASWTAASAPTTPTADEVQACATSLGFAGGTPVALTSDRRGDFTSLLVEEGSNDGYCVLAAGEVENWVDFEGLAAHPLADPNSAVISVMQGGEWMFVASGHAGANVTSLSVTNPETGQKVMAAVAKGVWSAWWPVGPASAAWDPGSAGDAYRDAITLDYQTANGETHTASGLSDVDDSVGGVAEPAAPVVLGTLSGWAATTAALDVSASEVDACGAAGDGWPTGSASTVIAETRGDFHSLLIRRAADEIYCVLKSGTVQWSREEGIVQIDPVAPGVAALTQGNGFDGVGESTRITELDGVVGDGVTSVTVHLAGGHDVQAAVQNGVWMAWWPEDEPPALGGPTPTPVGSTPADGSTAAPAPAGPPSFSWTTSDGVTHDSP